MYAKVTRAGMLRQVKRNLFIPVVMTILSSGMWAAEPTHTFRVQLTVLVCALFFGPIVLIALVRGALNDCQREMKETFVTFVREFESGNLTPPRQLRIRTGGLARLVAFLLSKRTIRHRNSKDCVEFHNPAFHKVRTRIRLVG